jgi:hypothetical protein
MITLPIKNRAQEEFLIRLAKEPGHNVRLWFSPSRTRMAPDRQPTEVQIVSDEACFEQYMEFEFNKEFRRVNVAVTEQGAFEESSEMAEAQ